MPALTPSFEIFKPGRWRTASGKDLSFTAADLAGIVADYDPSVYEAPLCVGHPKASAPAYGWVKGLRVADGRLIADSHQVDPAFAQMVRDGRFKNRSSSFFPPNDPANPKPGRYTLRHVAFLGANPPAVPGLKPANFAGKSAGIETVEFEAPGEGCVDAMEFGAGGDAGATKQEKAMPMTPEEIQAKEAELLKREAKFKEDTADFSARETKLREKETAQRTAEIATFVDGLVRETKVLPAQKEALVAFMAGIADDTTVEFSQGDGTASKAAGAFLREFLAALPKRVELGEIAGGPEQAPAAVDFAAPPRAIVDTERLALHRKAVALQAKTPGMDYQAALRAVGA